ncbi:MAG: aminotransferase class V-fold PLP-dependent enzyme [Actinobacteria bacterium]|nr:aminotransferase class V-fold PLP-dependent enzyme [Actinomycetota bacterium]MCB9412240.1 aminotransferase class V-fold PLP-dependent enzyme [Actinomycetota bacterium]
MSRVFLAAEAGQPASAVVRQARIQAESSAWARPTLRAHEGRVSRTMLEAAGTAVATAVGAPGARVVFYPSLVSALTAAVAQLGRSDLGAVTSVVDRRAVLDAVRRQTSTTDRESPPSAPRQVGVDRLGRIRLDELAAMLADGHVGLVVSAVGNPEVGTTQPLQQIRQLCRAHDVPLLVDASMAGGRMELPADWDALVLDAASWAGGNAAAVVVRPGVRWRDEPSAELAALPLGAPSVADCAAAALGLEAAVADLPAHAEHDRRLIESLREGLADVADVVVHGDTERRLPHVVGFSVLYVDAEAMLVELDRKGIAVASGSACAVESGQPSHVLAAIGTLTSGNLRVTLPLTAQRSDIDALLAELPPLVAQLRAEVGL